MARVTVEVYDDRSDELLRTVAVALSVDDVRTRWGSPAYGSFPLSPDDVAFLSTRGLGGNSPEDGEVGFVQIIREHAGETITDPDGEQWFPPPG